MNPELILTWLRVATACKDRVLCNALNTGTVDSITQEPPGWRIILHSKRGVGYCIAVVTNPVGQPERWYRDATTVLLLSDALRITW
jgi:hypothetical protein